MSQNWSSATVVIGTLRAKIMCEPSLTNLYRNLQNIGVAPIAHLCMCVIKIATFKGGHPMW